MNFNRLSDYMDKLCTWRIPGCACKVYHKGELVFEHSAGYADIENGIPLDADKHRMFMYSISKIVTCVTALSLWEEGKFLLTDPLSAYLPAWKNVKVKSRNEKGEEIIVPANREIRIQDLFTMTSGLDYNCESPALKAARERLAPHCPTVDIINALAEDPMVLQPGERWCYGLSHDVLGALVEVIEGKKLGEVAKERIFDPLGFTRTTYGLRAEDRGEMAVQYAFNDATDRIDRPDYQENWAIFGDEYHSGGAGVVSTVSEMALLMKALAAKGKIDDKRRILASRTVDLMRLPVLTKEQEKGIDWGNLAGYSYGLGVRTMKYPAQGGSSSPVGEFGWTGAAGGFAVIDPENDLAMFYAHHMVNNQEAHVTPRLRNILYSCLD